MSKKHTASKTFTRRDTLKTLGAAGLAAGALPLAGRYNQAWSSEPIRIGFQAHRTGIGAANGRW
jgi:branched-chain amino acid transport system substrate-binding protein